MTPSEGIVSHTDISGFTFQKFLHFAAMFINVSDYGGK